MRDPEGHRTLLAELLAMAAERRITPVEPTAYPLDQAARALHDLQSRRATGKVVVVP